ncbi:hypothetical protein Tco_0414248 [Tanacetum coccineum]
MEAQRLFREKRTRHTLLFGFALQTSTVIRIAGYSVAIPWVLVLLLFFLMYMGQSFLKWPGAHTQANDGHWYLPLGLGLLLLRTASSPWPGSQLLAVIACWFTRTVMLKLHFRHEDFSPFITVLVTFLWQHKPCLCLAFCSVVGFGYWEVGKALQRNILVTQPMLSSWILSKGCVSEHRSSELRLFSIFMLSTNVSVSDGLLSADSEITSVLLRSTALPTQRFSDHLDYGHGGKDTLASPPSEGQWSMEWPILVQLLTRAYVELVNVVTSSS